MSGSEREAHPDESGAGEARGSDFVQSLARGLSVIRAFDADHADLTLSDVARRAGMPAAAARRFLRTLETLGYVRADGRSFSLTPRVLELGFSYLSALSLPEVMQPHLERLSRAVDESVSAAVLSGSEIVYVARVPTRRIMTVGITIGTRFPAASTSMGRVLLADLDEVSLAAALGAEPSAGLLTELDTVRGAGWALVDGELEAGLRSIAAPVRGRDGRIAAAVNVSTSTSRTPKRQLLDEHLPLLRDTVAEIEAELRLL